MNSVECGLCCRVFGVVGDAGDRELGEPRLTARSRSSLGDVSGLLNRKGTAVEELGLTAIVGLCGVCISWRGDTGFERGSEVESNLSAVSVGEEGSLLGSGIDASSGDFGLCDAISDTVVSSYVALVSFWASEVTSGTVAPGHSVIGVIEGIDLGSTELGAEVGELGELAGRGGSSLASTRSPKKG